MEVLACIFELWHDMVKCVICQSSSFFGDHGFYFAFWEPLVLESSSLIVQGPKLIFSKMFMLNHNAMSSTVSLFWDLC